MLVCILHVLQCSIHIDMLEKFCFKFSTQQNIKADQKDKFILEADEMACLVKVLDINPDDLSSIPGSYIG